MFLAIFQLFSQLLKGVKVQYVDKISNQFIFTLACPFNIFQFVNQWIKQVFLSLIHRKSFKARKNQNTTLLMLKKMFIDCLSYESSLFYKHIIYMEHSGIELNPNSIMQVGFGFWPSKILLSAVSLGLFTTLAKNKKMSGKQIGVALGFQCSERHIYDFLDVLVTLKFLMRDGLLQSSLYYNTPNSDYFLDKQKNTYIGGILQMLNDRLFNMWGLLEQSLKTGQPYFQNHSNGVDPFIELYKDPVKLRGFVNAMGGMQINCFTDFADKFDFSKYTTMVDAGGSGADLAIQVAKKHPHMKCVSLDLPPVEPIAKDNIEKHGLTKQVTAISGDFFKQDLPKTDVLTMGFILHDWGMQEKEQLIKKAYDCLNPGGAFVALEVIIDEERKQCLLGLGMSINMLIETKGGFDFSFSEFSQWTKSAGFAETKLIQLDGFKKAAVAYK